MFAQCAARHTSLGKAVIIGVTNIIEKSTCLRKCFFLVGAGGFGPPMSQTTDLQSAPFGLSGTLPYGAGDRSRTNNLLITNQLLCH